MNTYLYPCITADGELIIKSVKARNYNECLDKIKSEYVEEYDDMNDILDFDQFVENLDNYHNIGIGDIYEIDEFL